VLPILTEMDPDVELLDIDVEIISDPQMTLFIRYVCVLIITRFYALFMNRFFVVRH
jgi:hypothetical protein